MLVGLLAIPATAQDQLLVNPSFENGPTPIVMPDESQVPPDGMGSMPDGWTLTRMNNHANPGAGKYGLGLYYFEGPLTDVDPVTFTARTDNRYLVSRYRWHYDGGTAEQTVIVPPGAYDLELSFYAWIFVYEENPDVSQVSGEIIVDGEVVAAAHLASTHEGAGYKKVTANWKGQVGGEITVRITTLVRGFAAPGGEWYYPYACIVIDDVELWSRACGSQHELTDITPNVVDFVSVPAEATVTISGDVADGDTIEIDTGGVNRVYEFDTNALLNNASAVAVDVSTAQDKAGAKAALIQAINDDAQAAPCSASDPGGDDVLLTWDANGGDGATNTNNNDTNNVIAVTDFAQAAQPSITITISGSTNLTHVDSVRLWRAGFDESTVEIVGSNLSTGPGFVTADFVTNGANDGFYDVIVEQTGCNPRVITGGLQIRDGSAAPNLLQNPSFEVLIQEGHCWNSVGNGQIWSGDYYKDPALNATPLDGEHGIWSYWSNSGGSGESEATSTWQTVPVASGSGIHFVGYLDCNADAGSTSTATLTVYDGVGNPGDPQIGSETVTQASVGEVGNWTEVDISGTANSGFVTVAFTTQINPVGGVAAVFADRFSLTAAPPCPEGLYARFAYPSSTNHLGSLQVTITGGSSLDTVGPSGVMLMFVDDEKVGDEPEQYIPGSIVSQSQGPTSMQVYFDMAAAGARAGLYNLVIEKPGCPSPNLVDLGWVATDTKPRPPAQIEVPPTFVDKVEVACANPIVLNRVEPGSLVSPQTYPELLILGENLDALGSVSLVSDSTSHLGTITQVAPDGSWVTVKWTYMGPPWPFGPYDVVGTRADGLCDDPEPLVDSFRLLASDNMLLNAGFEDDLAEVEPETPAAWPDYWPRTQTANGGIEWVSSNWYNGAGPRTGARCAGAASNWMVNSGYVEQSIGLPNGAGAYDLTLSFWGQFYDDGGTPSTVKGEIWVDGSVAASVTLDNGGVIGQLTPYTQASVDWKGTANNDITVRITAEGNGNPSFGVAVVDDIELIMPVVRCHTPFADADDDNDVDVADFGMFQICYTGPNGTLPASPEYCTCFDRPEGPLNQPDGDVDEADLVIFSNCALGPGIMADPSCGL